MQELRSTTGQRVFISYDPASNAMVFHETDWFADPIRSTGVPVKSNVRRPPNEVVAVRARRKLRRAK